jgi:putative aldouronate transport system permease protein
MHYSKRRNKIVGNENVSRLKIKYDRSALFVRSLGYVVIGTFALICLIPFISVVNTSFSSEKAVMRQGYALFWPREFTSFAYRLLFENPNILIGSYIVTIY